jgi:hypothetical protein
MGAFFTVLVLCFAIALPVLIGFVLFEVSPFGRHSDHYRDPRTGKRRWESPNLNRP